MPLEPNTIEIGIPGDEQRDNFTNATLQSVGNNIDISIATYIDIPDSLSSKGEEAIQRYLTAFLASISRDYANIRFDVQIGPTEKEEEELSWQDAQSMFR